jgi:hypothetical protein
MFEDIYHFSYNLNLILIFFMLDMLTHTVLESRWVYTENAVV